MKKLVIIFFVFCSSWSFSQQGQKLIKSSTSTLKWTLNSKEDFKKIEWQEIKKVFQDNEKKDTITIGFELKVDKNKNSATNFNLEVKGLAENIDGLVSILKKSVKILDNVKTK